MEDAFDHVIQHTPSASTEPKSGDVLLKFDTCKRFCENVGGVDDPGSVLDVEVTILNLRAYEMIADINVFGFSVRRIIGSEGESTIVVCFNEKSGGARDVKFIERLAYPHAFLYSPG